MNKKETNEITQRNNGCSHSDSCICIKYSVTKGIYNTYLQKLRYKIRNDRERHFAYIYTANINHALSPFSCEWLNMSPATYVIFYKTQMIPWFHLEGTCTFVNQNTKHSFTNP